MVQAVAVRQTESQRWQAALERAVSDSLDVLVEPLSGSAFVESATTPGVLYLVTAGSCTCPAGAHGGICKHRAIYLAMVGELPVDNTIEQAPADCASCSGCGVQWYRGGFSLPCESCRGRGVLTDLGPQTAPQAQPDYAVA